MGALTLKSFPFELRGWDLDRFDSLDPTDSFGSQTRIYINKDQIVQIEPDYDSLTYNTWLSDKGRQFFDSIFNTWQNKTGQSQIAMFKSLILTIYLFEHCNQFLKRTNFLTFVFENLSIEVLSLLIILSQNYSFIKVKKAESANVDNDLESNFQVNSVTDHVKINNSSLSLLISTNSRYEGYYLNLLLRQRFLKGGFKCLVAGSNLNLTFPTTFLGSNLKILKNIAEGNNLTCQDFKNAQNPNIILNTELLKRNDKLTILELVKTLNSNCSSTNQLNINVLNASLSETGTNLINKFECISSKELNSLSSIYFLNISSNNLSNLKKIAITKLLNYTLQRNHQPNKINTIMIDQNSLVDNNLEYFKKNLNTKSINYSYVPTSMFYENDSTFINTQGIIKKTRKIIFRKKTKNNWQILRKFLVLLKKNAICLNKKDNNILFFNSKKLFDFKNFINFQYLTTKSLTNLNFYLSIKNKPVQLNPTNFKNKLLKLNSTKTKYWLDDFFHGGKDEYSQNSLILANCSSYLRTESNNFF